MTHFHHDTIQRAYSSLAVTSTDSATAHLIHFNLGQRSRVTHTLRCSQTLRGALQELRKRITVTEAIVAQTCEHWNQVTLENAVEVAQTSSVAA